MAAVASEAVSYHLNRLWAKLGEVQHQRAALGRHRVCGGVQQDGHEEGRVGLLGRAGGQTAHARARALVCAVLTKSTELSRVTLTWADTGRHVTGQEVRKRHHHCGQQGQHGSKNRRRKKLPSRRKVLKPGMHEGAAEDQQGAEEKLAFGAYVPTWVCGARVKK